MSSVNPKTAQSNTPHPIPPTDDETRRAEFRQQIEQVRADDPAYRDRLAAGPDPVRVAGSLCFTPAEVIDRYQPRPSPVCTPSEWELIGTSVRQWVRKTTSPAPSTALARLIATTGFAAWCVRNDVPMDAEFCFIPERIEQYVASRSDYSTRGRLTLRSNLRAVALACTVRARWQQPPTVYTGNYLPEPYTPDDIAGFRQAARAQSTRLRRRSMDAMLTLGLGGGLRAPEVELVRAHHVLDHPVHDGLLVIVLPRRVVPVRHEMSAHLRTLCAETRSERLAGRTQTLAPRNRTRDHFDLPSSLPALHLRRLRTTWALACLRDGLNMAEFHHVSATSSSGLWGLLTHHVPIREHNDEWMLLAAGLSRTTLTPRQG